MEDLPNFYSWETPEFEITITPAGSLEGSTDIVVTVQQGSISVNLHKEDLSIDGDKIFFILSQEDAGKFVGDRQASVQVNILYDDETRYATAQGKILVKPNLYRKVME